MTNNERKATVGWPNWVPNVCGPTTTSNVSNTPSTGDIGSNLFILGDSIMQGAYYGGGLDRAFRQADINATVDAQVSRSITRPGQTTNPVNNKLSSGLEAVTIDANHIRDASAIVVELGTNTDGSPSDYKDKLTQLVNKIRGYNQEAPLFLVNIFSPVITDRAARNRVIEDVASREGGTVIDVTADRIDTDDDIHPSPNGYGTYNRMVLESLQQNQNAQQQTVASAPEADTSGQAECCSSSGGGSVDITGETTGPPKAVQKIVWNTLTAAGIDDMHAAAVMGNIAHEGLWNPMQTEFASALGGADSEDPSSVGSYGYGLIGWTPGTRLLDSMKEAGISGKPYTAETQAAVILAHIQGKTPAQYTPDVGERFLATNTIEAATTAYQGTATEKGFENPADPVGSLQKRINSAKHFLQEFGGTTGTAPVGESGAGLCCPDGSAPGATVAGNDPKATIWNYLVGEMKLSSTQAAGIMGNIEQESGFSPTAENPSSGAYGIIQWYAGRKTNLQNYASDQGKQASDITVQLEFMKKELEDPNGSYKSTVLDPIKRSTSLEEVTRIWLEKYEVPCLPGSSECDAEMGIRLPNAKAVLREFGNGAVTDPAAGCGNGGVAGTNGWSLEGPNAMVYYAQCDPKWKDSSYGSSTICVGGCGITSMAMVIATLSPNGKGQTPQTLARQYGGRYHVDGVGTSWGLWPVAARDYGLKQEDIGTDLNKAAETVKNGGLVIISVNPPSEFTGGGHIMVIRAVDDQGNFLLADPNEGNVAGGGDTNKTPYSADFLRTKGGLVHLWAFTK